MVLVLLSAGGGSAQRAGPGGTSDGGSELRLSTPAAEIRIDGRLDEAGWAEAPVVSEFVQGEPVEGAPAEQPTEVRILFEEEAIYVGARLTEAEGRVARQLVRRDETGQAHYFGRDRADLLDLHPDNMIIVKLNYWLGL